MRANQYFPVDRAIALYVDEKLSLRQVAQRLGCSAMTVKAWLVRTGVTLRRCGGANNPWGVKGRPKNVQL